jgi:hypothetical protein
MCLRCRGRSSVRAVSGLPLGCRQGHFQGRQFFFRRMAGVAGRVRRGTGALGVERLGEVLGGLLEVLVEFLAQTVCKGVECAAKLIVKTHGHG